MSRPWRDEIRTVRLRFILGLSAVLAIAIGSVLGAIAVRDQETGAFERRQREEALRSARQAEAAAASSPAPRPPTRRSSG
jgi:hypothetical protein